MAEWGDVVTAARLGEVFHIDPLYILDQDDMNWWLLVACGHVIGNDRQEAMKQKKPSIFDS